MRLALLTLMLVLVAAPAEAATVTVVPVDGTPQPVELPAPDVLDRAYGTERVTGTSLGALLRSVSADVDLWAYAEVRGAGGAVATFERAAALDGDPPAVFAADGAGVRLVRADAAAVTGDLVVALVEQLPLTVRATATPRRPDAGEEVRFTAEVEGAGDEEVTLSWWFDDGRASSDDAAPRHRFSKPGTYRVVVGATTPSDAAGASAVVTVRVGGGEEEEEEEEAPGDDGGGAETAAPDEAGAGGGDDAAGAGAGGDGGATATAAEPDRPRRDRPAPQAPPAATEDGPPLVAGELISLAAAPAGPAAASAPATATAKASLRLPPEAWVGLATLALLGIALARELRRSQPEWTP